MKAFNFSICALTFVATISPVLAAPDKKQGFLQRKNSRHVQDQEAKTRAVNSNNMFDERDAQLHNRTLLGYFGSQGGGEDGDKTAWISFTSYMTRVATQLLLGLFYYTVIVSKYPSFLGEPTPAAKKLQAINEIRASCEVSLPNCIFSLCCSGARAAHTFYSVGISDYWCSLFGMSVCPCCVLCVADSCTDLNERLGGQSRGWFVSCLCSFCCSCCMIAQDAESLDLITGVKTGFCGVYESRDL
mmetsp:Transcript_134688/g.245767  ORF Transcript_134688/g.245767 Transcript_134688/m.245767 type:complete len:244 (-) Transcript_134688:41-772(-)